MRVLRCSQHNLRLALAVIPEYLVQEKHPDYMVLLVSERYGFRLTDRVARLLGHTQRHRNRPHISPCQPLVVEDDLVVPASHEPFQRRKCSNGNHLYV